MERPRAILFDADGVVQHASLDFRQAFAAVLGREGDELATFMREVFAVEKPALRGGRDFVGDLMEVLTRFGVAERLDAALAVWTAVEPDQALLDAIARLRGSGVCCCLATNQQPYRGRHMSEVLGYRERFDHEFYSHQLGCAKPEPEYFQAICERLTLPAESLLFIDDHEANVEAARAAGLRGALFPHPTDASVAALQAILEQHGLALP